MYKFVCVCVCERIFSNISAKGDSGTMKKKMNCLNKVDDERMRDLTRINGIWCMGGGGGVYGDVGKL